MTSQSFAGCLGTLDRGTSPSRSAMTTWRLRSSSGRSSTTTEAPRHLGCSSRSRKARSDSRALRRTRRPCVPRQTVPDPRPAAGHRRFSPKIATRRSGSRTAPARGRQPAFRARRTTGQRECRNDRPDCNYETRSGKRADPANHFANSISPHERSGDDTRRHRRPILG